MTTETNIPSAPTPEIPVRTGVAGTIDAGELVRRPPPSNSGRSALGPPAEVAKRLPGNILIIDDEPANVVIARKHLERAGYYSFKTTTDSTVAYNLIQASKPDVVLLDINMPEVSGIEILKQIRANKETRQLPVLILTANDDYAIKVVCLELELLTF